MAIDPAAPLTPVHPALSSVGTPADSAAALLARARAALTEGVATLGEMIDGTSGLDDPAKATAKTSSGLPAPGAAAAPTVSIPERLVAAVRVAVAQAAPRQAGLAPLMADLVVALDRPDTPPPVRQAARTLLDRAVPTDAPVTPAVLREAVRRSGTFLEADLARHLAPDRASPAPAPPRDMKAALLVFKAVVSTWLAEAPPAADSPEPGPAKPGLTTPHAPAGAPPARPAPTEVGPAPHVDIRPEPTAVAARPGGGAPSSTPSLPSTPSSQPAAERSVSAPLSNASSVAVSTSMEAGDQAAPLGARPDDPQSAPPARSPAPPPPPLASPPTATITGPAPPPAAAPPAAVMMLMVGLIEEEPRADLPVTDAEGPHPADASAPGIRPAQRPPPPYAGGPTTAQPAAASDLRDDTPPLALARRLLADVSGAIARQELLQIASLPEGRADPERPAETRPTRVVIDLPFQTPQGVAVAQFEISRDGGGGGGASGGGEVERTWRARFSLDVEPLGPVHVQVALTGVQTRVSLWAERPESMARLRAGEETLSAALRQAELTPEVAFHAGAPHTAPSAPGRFVDRAS